MKFPLERDFSGGPVVKTLCFHCRGCGFDPWSGNWDPACCTAQPKRKRKKSSQQKKCREHPCCSSPPAVPGRVPVPGLDVMRSAQKGPQREEGGRGYALQRPVRSFSPLLSFTASQHSPEPSLAPRCTC